MAKKDSGVPINEIFSRAERNRLGFFRWHFRRNPEKKPDAKGRRMWQERPREMKSARRIQPGPGGRGTI